MHIIHCQRGGHRDPLSQNKCGTSKLQKETSESSSTPRDQREMAETEDVAKGEKEYQLQGQHSYKIVNSYMPESFEQDAVKISIVAVDKFRHLKDIAYYIKHEYDKKYPGSGKATEGVYHCAVGKSFASEKGAGGEPEHGLRI